MKMKQHGNFSHGLAEAQEHDLNCLACRSEIDGPRFTYSQAVHVLRLLGATTDDAYRAVSWCQLNPHKIHSIAGVNVTYRGGTYWWGIRKII